MIVRDRFNAVGVERKTPLAFIGFGEAAQALCEGWAMDRPADILAYDRKTDDLAQADAKRSDYARYGVIGCADAAAAACGAGAIISVVTADQALPAAQAAALALAPGTLYFDLNSVAPATKIAACRAISDAGGLYVDVAVMAPVRPALAKVPLLVSGPHAIDGAAYLAGLGCVPRVIAGDIGAASATKMIRSIMIKGIEALSAECLLSAVAAGVEDEVIASLDDSFPGWDWRERGDYNLERMFRHGSRRAAEMRQSAMTADALGCDGRMAAATADWQDRLGALAFVPLPDGLVSKATAILASNGIQPS